MNSQSVNLTPEKSVVLRKKHTYGILYGAVVGLAFAVFCWGIDNYILSNYHGIQPWLKFGIGSVLCIIPGGIAGWLSAKLEKSLYSLLLWLVTGSIFAWLTVNLPLVIAPKALNLLEPQLGGILHYPYFDDFNTRIVVAYTWISIFISLVGLLQIPLSDSAVFSTSFFGKIAPLLVTAILMSITGTIVDAGLINEPLRSSTIAVDNTIQFIIDNRGKDVDKAEARRMHTGAFRAIDESVTSQRELIVSGYNGELGEINVLVRFERDLVECQVHYSQPITCKIIEASQ
ncbi:MAG TPA: hypothetical protein VJ987_14560 [Anaerolineales bacterium]|nr:hypothetical protein [Anaerolineales bacterium]